MIEDIYHRPIAKHGGSKYVRRVTDVSGEGGCDADVYAVLRAFNVTCPGLQQAAKKILCAGVRGKGSRVQDIKETFDALFRALQFAEQEEEEAKITAPAPAPADQHDWTGGGQVVMPVCKRCGIWRDPLGEKRPCLLGVLAASHPIQVLKQGSFICAKCNRPFVDGVCQSCGGAPNVPPHMIQGDSR